jgi:hypothetical protein
MAAITITFQKIKDWAEAEGLKTSMKEVKLHTPEAKRNRANALSTRLLACCKTSMAKMAYVRQLVRGIMPHKFI